LPVDYDTWFVEELSLAASEYAAREYGVDSLVLPVIPFGPTPEHRGFGSGYIHLPQSVHELVIAAVLDSLVEQKFRRMIIWRGCGQHNLMKVVERFSETHAGNARVFQPELPYYDIWSRVSDASIPGGHAENFSTSLAMYLRPESVRKEKIFNPESELVDWEDPELDFSRYSKTGVIGDPTHASEGLGAELWQQAVQEVSEVIKHIADVSFS
jgi:creatinine amidohydrolase